MRVFEPDDTQSLTAEITAVIATRTGTAGAGIVIINL